MSKEGFDPYKKSEIFEQPDKRSPYKEEKVGKDRTIKLDSVLKTQFERAFGVDLSDVRIHTGPFSDDITRRSHADAVTIGKDIYFHTGKYAPDTEEGKNLLAHDFLHFQDDKRMVYREDIAEIEEDADVSEMLMAGLHLHNVSKPYLQSGKSRSLEGDDDDYVYNETKEQVKESPKSLEGFGLRRDKPLYSVYFSSTGKTYTVTQNEKEKAIVSALKKYRDYIDREAALLPEHERQQFIIKHLSFLFNL